MILPVVQDVLASAGVERSDIGFWCHGSCDYMIGQPFSFVAAVDALGAWPPIVESHVEADGAFALYEAWVKIQTGECDTALVFSNGKSSAGPIADILTFQLDPYLEAPLRAEHARPRRPAGSRRPRRRRVRRAGDGRGRGPQPSRRDRQPGGARAGRPLGRRPPRRPDDVHPAA